MTLTLISRDPLTSILSGYGVGQPGQFSIRSFYALPPGIYDVFVVGTGQDMDYFGSTPVTLGDQAIEGVAISLHPGAEVKGHVTIRGAAADMKLNTAPINLRSLSYNSASRAARRSRGSGSSA